MASYCHHLIDSGPAFWIFKFLRRQTVIFGRIMVEIFYIFKTPKDFSVLDLASYCHHRMDSRPAFWMFKFVHRQNHLLVRPLFFTNNIS